MTASPRKCLFCAYNKQLHLNDFYEDLAVNKISNFNLVSISVLKTKHI